MTEIRYVKKALAIIWVLFFLSVVILYLVGGEQLQYAFTNTGEVVRATNDVGELTTGKVIEQAFRLDGNELQQLKLYGYGYDYDYPVGGIMEVSILDEDGAALYDETMDMALLSGEGELVINFDPLLEVGSDSLPKLRITVIDGSQGSVPTLYYGSSISLARGEAQIRLQDEEKVSVDGVLQDGRLCFQVTGRREIWLGSFYWAIAAAAALLLAGFSMYTLRGAKRGSGQPFLKMLRSMKKYRFLIEQLVSRDFKTKYKRSALGVLWSFLNPMLVMTVQYIVFSTIFRSDIENFAVYLLTGIVCYNFFSEVTSLSVTAIVGNASLITKVYIPKVIYPVSRALSSMINFLLSLLPLLSVMLVTRTKITPAVLLLPFAVACLLALSMGVGMVLSSAMVFFRDTQFLWNVLNMVWMYLTPIFYPENIVTGWQSYILKLNPLYHIIRFFRIVLLDGISPEPKAYLLCFAMAAVPLAVGYCVFRKTEDRFVLHI